MDSAETTIDINICNSNINLLLRVCLKYSFVIGAICAMKEVLDVCLNLDICYLLMMRICIGFGNWFAGCLYIIFGFIIIILPYFLLD